MGPRDESALWVDELFLVGDIFDLWFARGGRVYPPFREVIKRLVELREAGVVISLCEGNHDFFLADYFTLRLGMTVYPEWAERVLDGKRVLVAHGDTIDDDNRHYLLCRKFLRSPLIYNLQKILPLPLLWAVAEMASRTSRNLMKDRTEELTLLLHEYARKKLAQGRYDMIIFGHSHKPLVTEHVFDDEIHYAATLGDWLTHRSYIYFEDGRIFRRHYEMRA